MFLLFSSTLLAQTTTTPPKPNTSLYAFDFGDQAITVTAGFSPTSVRNIGVTTDRKLFKAGAGYSWVVVTNHKLTLRYVLGISPLIFVTQPAAIDFKHSTPSNIIVRSARTTYGFGGDPLGLRLNLGARKIQPFVDTHAGLVIFTDDVPVPDSSQLNFMFSFGGGLEFFRESRNSWTLGYRYHHISNDEVGVRNPGIDNHMIYVSYTWARKGR
jgi:hypothetical protein